MKRSLSVLLILFISLGIKVKADEGMWLLPLIEKLNIGKMTELGLKLSSEEIYSLNKVCLKDAVVSIPGCTAELVSSQGLILTNHHCGYESIQAHSSVEHDYLKEGFWAMSKEEELPNDDMYANFLISIEDVTNQVLENVKPGMSEAERNTEINRKRLSLEKEATRGNNYLANVSSFYGGNYFYLLVYERYNDIRLVGAPPSSIGKFGFDTDNWEWPRHTGDFSIFRIYSGPDGKPAPYSKENIPLKPKYWLPVSIKDLNKGDYVMILGYPGHTQRYYTSYEVNEILKITNPNRIRIRGIKQEIMMADMMADNKVNISYADKYSVSSNYWKYSIGQNKGLERLNVIAKKEQTETKFNTWINADISRKEEFGRALNLIKTSIDGRSELQNTHQYIYECFNQGCELLQINYIASALKGALNSGKPDRIADVIANIRNNIGEIYKDYNPATEQKLMKAMLKLYRTDIPEKFHPDFYTDLVDKKYKGSIDRFIDEMFTSSLFTSEEKLMAFLEKPTIKSLNNDLLCLTAESINKISAEVSKDLSRFDSNLATGRRLWIAGLKEMTPEKTLYPDANSTMRLSYGTIQDYYPRDAVKYNYYTTLQGLVEKYKPGDYEFDLPKRLIELYNRKEYGRYGSSGGYMTVCFLTNTDITGGNSGSPVLNAKGELIGLAFDGNWEAMSGDIAFENAIQRTIVVDIRYVLWVMDIYAGAKHLVNEMTIVQ